MGDVRPPAVGGRSLRFDFGTHIKKAQEIEVTP